MRPLKLTFIILLSVFIYAQPVQIDMHGGKHIKHSSQMNTQKPKSLHEMLRPYTQNEDTNKTSEVK